MQFYVDQRKPIGASNIPVERYESARQQMTEIPRINSGQAIAFPSINEETLSGLPPASSTTNFSSWIALGPGNVGGRTRTLAINPSTPDTMYTAGVAGGIWKTTNGGTNWTPLNDLMNNMAVTTIVIDPSNHDTLYAGTGEGFFNGDAVRGDGIFKSTDGGANWTHLSATSNNSNFHYVNKLAISSNDSNRIYAATRGGVFRSTDGGTTWSSVRSASTFVGCLDIQVRTDVNPDVLITSCGSFIQSAIYRSIDGGDNWTQVLTETNMGRSSLAIAPSNQNTMYALSATNQSVSGNYSLGLHAVFKSTDGGATWNPTVRNTDSNKLNTVFLSNTLFAFYADCGFGSTNQFFNQGWYDNVSRLRNIQFGSKNELYIDIPRGEMKEIKYSCALASDGRSFAELKFIQGLDESYDLPDFTVAGKKKMVGNGVPLSIGRVLAQAVLDVTDPGAK